MRTVIDSQTKSGSVENTHQNMPGLQASDQQQIRQYINLIADSFAINFQVRAQWGSGERHPGNYRENPVTSC